MLNDKYGRLSFDCRPRHVNIQIETIREAAGRIESFVRHTALERSRWLSRAGRDVLLKLECFQITGSFKARGAMARLTTLTEAARARGILTVSAGNRGLPVTQACSRARLRPTMVLPRTASPAKPAPSRS